MQFYRLYAGADGQSHFEKLDSAKATYFNDTKPAASHLFRDDFAPHIVNFHRAPRRRWVVTLTGSVKIGVGDGSSMTFYPGDVFSPKTPPAKAHRDTDRLDPTLCEPRLNKKLKCWSKGVLQIPRPITPLLHATPHP